jgi:hypothetical protein
MFEIEAKQCGFQPTSGIDPQKWGRKKGFWLKRSGVDHEKVNFDL